MDRIEAVTDIIGALDDDLPIVHANGMISRESFSVKDRKANFYMIGSMGLTMSIGLGAALARPDKKVAVLDGDGNVLMNMGTLAQIGALAPANLYHICLDNQTYASTGDQPTISGAVALERIAAAAGYTRAWKVTERAALVPALHEMFASDGPAFLLVKVAPGNLPGVARIPYPPEEIRDNFSAAMKV